MVPPNALAVKEALAGDCKTPKLRQFGPTPHLPLSLLF